MKFLLTKACNNHFVIFACEFNSYIKFRLFFLHVSKKLLVCLLLIVISACGGGSPSVENNDSAINAIDVSNKSQYKELAENRNREPVTFSVVGNTAYMQGVMDSTIPHLTQNLLNNYPNVDTIVMKNVLGTIDFSATLEAGRMIRDACLTTVVPVQGKITSGGVYFFMAGCRRIVESNSYLGIHTWKNAIYDNDGNIVDGKTAAEFPIGDPIHNAYLNYQTEMNIPADFYWVTVNTPFDDMHFLSQSEIESFQLITDSTKSWGANYKLTIDSHAPLSFSTARFYVDNGIAVMHGTITNKTSSDFLAMLQDNPEVHTLELGYVTGSKATQPLGSVKLGYAVREKCLTTSITASSVVMNEAINAYLAGCRYEIDPNGRVGISSWIDFNYDDNETAIFIENIHRTFEKYYSDIGVPQAFYLHQLEIPRSQPEFISQEVLQSYGVL